MFLLCGKLCVWFSERNSHVYSAMDRSSLARFSQDIKRRQKGKIPTNQSVEKMFVHLFNCFT